jgi:hypothetical protein
VDQDDGRAVRTGHGTTLSVDMVDRLMAGALNIMGTVKAIEGGALPASARLLVCQWLPRTDRAVDDGDTCTDLPLCTAVVCGAVFGRR